MDPRHRLLGQRWPPADEVDQPIVGKDRTWLRLQEQLGHIARAQPIRVFSRDRIHIGGLALEVFAAATSASAVAPRQARRKAVDTPPSPRRRAYAGWRSAGSLR